MSTSQKSKRARETLPYCFTTKPCSTCGVELPLVAFPKYGDGSYADRCQRCRDANRKRKPKDVIRISIERSKKAWRSKKKMEAADVAS